MVLRGDPAVDPATREADHALRVLAGGWCGGGCDGVGSAMHTCPYKVDVSGDGESLCNCCEACEHDCAMDV